MDTVVGFEFGEPVTKGNIAIVERKVFVKVKKTISVLENAISKWNNAKTKPEELRPKFMRYKKLHEELSQWGKGLVQTKKRKLDFEARVERLRKFVEICQMNT
jgi:hypothetical protein